MKAVRIAAPLEIGVAEIERPALGAGEVLVKIRYVGFCGSDLNTYLGRNPMVKMPVVPGHEVGAVIEKVGEGVPATLREGMTVTLNPYTNCGSCASCRNGRYNACEHNETLGVQRQGVMCEYAVLPWTKIIPAEGIDVRTCALIEPMSVGFHAVARCRRYGQYVRHGDRLRHGRPGRSSVGLAARRHGNSSRHRRREAGTGPPGGSDLHGEHHDRGRARPHTGDNRRTWRRRGD